MSKSIDRVRQAAIASGLDIEIRRMGESTRTAEEAAQRCGSLVDQIVKSLVFEGEESGELMLFLMRGSRRLDPAKAARAAGEPLKRATPEKVREITGFAIGGVAPIGHKNPIRAFADQGLLAYDHVWAAAGAHDAVFRSEPSLLIAAARAATLDLADSK
jgi:prolyl-tRNA editing enzyme YbaK/EbsC (Cys-tRNA(Pro) deacylase)